jgi:hypothetical protein
VRLVPCGLVVLAAGVDERHSTLRAEAIVWIVVLATARRADKRITRRR